MRAAGVRRFGNGVETLELPGPGAARPDEVLLDVRDGQLGQHRPYRRLGSRCPPADGTGCRGGRVVAAAGDRVDGIKVGDRVTTHSLPLRQQGAWAEQFIAAAEHVAVLPPGVPFGAAGVLPVPALTADQAVGDALQVRAGQTVLVNGAGGVTGDMPVQLAAHREATVIATAGASDADRLTAMGAATVLDYHQADWPEQVRTLANGGVDAAANAVPSEASEAVTAVGDGSRLVTITSDPPAVERGITVAAVLVDPDGVRLSGLVQPLAQGALTVRVGGQFALEQAAEALAQVRHGAHGSAIVLPIVR